VCQEKGNETDMLKWKQKRKREKLKGKGQGQKNLKVYQINRYEKEKKEMKR